MGNDFDLRSFTEDEGDSGFDDDDESLFDEAAVDDVSGPFLGMTPMERMFVSIFLFINVAVLGVALLLAFERI